MEAGASSSSGSARLALRQRSDRRRVGADWPPDPACQARRAASDGRRARGAQRHLQRALDRVAVEGAAERPPAAQHGLGIPGPVDWDGTLGRIHHVFYVEARETAGREASPTTAIIDSQSAKGALKDPLGRGTNAVLHPWLREHLSAILAALPVPKASQDPAATQAAWAVWQEGLRLPFTLRPSYHHCGCWWCGIIWPATRRRTGCYGCVPTASCRFTRPWVAAGSKWPNPSGACSSAARWTDSIRTAQTRSGAGLSRPRGTGMSNRFRLCGTPNGDSDDRVASRPTSSVARARAHTKLSVATERPDNQNADPHSK